MTTLLYNTLLAQSVQNYPVKPCFHIKRQGIYHDWTYGDFNDQCNRIVSALEQSGFSNDSHGIIIGENTPEWVIAYHALIFARGRAVPVDPNLPGDEIHEIVKVTQPVVIFCSRNFLPFMQDLKNEFACIKNIILLDRHEHRETIYTYGEFVAKGIDNNALLERTFTADHPVAVLFTSGTTGKAKGVVLTMQNLSVIGTHGPRRARLTHHDTVIAVLPLYHVFGFAACIITSLSCGMNIVFVPEMKGPLILEALKDKKVSILPAVPKMLTLFYETINRNVRQKGLPIQIVFGLLKGISRVCGPFLGMRFRAKIFPAVHKTFGGNCSKIISGGAALDIRCFNGFRLMGFNIVEGYGLTETFGPITLCPIDNPKQGSVGPVLPGNEMIINCPNDRGIGEVFLRGECVFAGYLNNDTATKAVIDSQGWFHTGDLGHIDSQGYLHLCGRSKDIIILESGKNVYPDELEEFYATSKAIEELGIFGFKTKEKEIVAAVIVPSPEIREKYTLEHAQEIIMNELLRMGRNRPTYKKITDFTVRYTPLPRTSTKKIKKNELAALYSAQKKLPRTSVASSTKLTTQEDLMVQTAEYGKIIDGIRPLIKKKEKELSPRTDLVTECEVDSLGFIDIISAIEEQFGISVPEETLSAIHTIADLYTTATRIYKDIGEDVPHRKLSIRQRIAAGSEITVAPPVNNNIIFNTATHLVTGIAEKLWDVKVFRHAVLTNSKPLLFVSNHQSQIDIIWILGNLPDEVRRRTYTIGKSDLLRNPLLSPILKRCNYIPIAHEKDIVEVLKKCIAVVRNNNHLVIFPEGTVSSDGTLQNFKPGIGLIILETNVTVVPIKILGSHKVWGAGKMARLSRPEIKPTITFGKPTSYLEMIENGLLPRTADEDEITLQIRKIIEGM